MAPTLQYILSYAARDNYLAQEFRRHLIESLNENELKEVILGQFGSFTEGTETSGSYALESADLAFLLLSPEAFVESWSAIHHALEQHDLGYMRMIPVILRHSHWKAGTRLDRLSILPKDERPIDDHPNRELAWQQVAEQLKGTIRKLETNMFYKRLARKGLESLRTGTVEEVPYFDNPLADPRLGLTLKVSPSQQVCAAFNQVIQRLKRFAPENLYYQTPQFHFTILSIITAHKDFVLSEMMVNNVRQSVDEVLLKSPPISVDFSGICATPNSIIARGFPDEGPLETLRDQLRKHLTLAGVGCGLDDRYRIQGAHVTLGRLRHGVNQDALLVQLGKLSDEPLGKMQVKHVELAMNDFFMLPEKVRTIATFPLQIPKAISPIPIPESSSHMDGMPGASRLPEVVVGRDEECLRILGILLHEQRPIIVTSGFGGIGKSTLAAYAASKCASEFDVVIWLDLRLYVASQRLSLEWILSQIATVLRIGAEVFSLQLEERPKRIIEELCRHRTLLVFDNYETLLSVPTVEREVSNFIQQLPAGLRPCVMGKRIGVIVTTRKITDGLSAMKPWDVTPEALSVDNSIAMMKIVAKRKPRKPPLDPLTDVEYRRVHALMNGLPKYMEVAVDQLSSLHFSDWERQVNVIPVPLDESDRFFGDLFAISWQTPEILSTDVKHVLLATTHFVANASYEALQKVSGLSEAMFGRAVSDAYPHLVPSLQGEYTIHPLTHAFCKSQLASSEFSDFRRQSANRFIQVFRVVAVGAKNPENNHEVESVLQNIVAAARLAFDLQLWQFVVEMHEPLAGFLRQSGHWKELIDILELVELVCERTGNKELLCRCLVNHHAWVLLRREDLRDADLIIANGLKLSVEVKDHESNAQVKRHAGKSALLKADYELFELYNHGETWHDYFRKAADYYQQSLQMREKLHLRRSDQIANIADMKMDFGRLHWLAGRKIEREGRKQQNKDMLRLAQEQYELALQVSIEAKTLSESISLERGVSKSFGNCGNATKELARYLFRENQLQAALAKMKEAEIYYMQNLRIGEQIGKRDEVSHALWGVAEVYEFIADHDPEQSKPWIREELLRKALQHAQDSNRFYRSFGGGKDIGVTALLANRIRHKIKSEYSIDYFKELFANLDRISEELSLKTSCVELPQFLEIIALGLEGFPHLLESLKWEARCWPINALEMIVVTRPFAVEPNGVRKPYEQCTVHEKSENWLTWAREQGFTP